MKKLLGVLLVALCTVSVLYAASNKVVVEAEKASTIVPSMVKFADSTASGGYAIGIPLARPHATAEGAPKDQGRAVYKVNIPSAGTWRFWGRVKWTDGCGNSFFVKIGNNSPAVFGQDGTYGTWHWFKIQAGFSLPAGPVTIIVQNREDGSKIDQFLLTKDTRYVPVRTVK